MERLAKHPSSKTARLAPAPRWLARAGWLLGSLVALFLTSATASAQNCVELRGANLGGAQVRTAIEMQAGEFTSPSGQRFDIPVSLCRLVLTARPHAGSNITVEVWLPAPESWNGRLLGTGNGGFAGTIAYHALADGVQRGYAAANTDMGTHPAGLFPQASYDAGIGHEQMVRDWGHRATHEMTVAARAAIERFYGAGPNFSYFMGCSTGGHQGLMEVQRHPNDYDGVLAGAPGHNRTHLHADFVRSFQLISQTPGLATPEKFARLRSALIMACGRGRDGGAPEDDFLNNPAACRFDLSTLACGQDDAEAACLSEADIAALTEIRDGLRNPSTREIIYPAWPSTAEHALLINGSPRSSGAARADGPLRWVMGPNWDARGFDFDADMDRVDGALGNDVNALDADLDGFQARGGRLILYHGWEDPIVSAYDTASYFQRVQARDRRAARNSVRLFMAPGVSHCQGGSGPDVFGAQSGSSQPGDPRHDLLAALVQWVEEDRAPEHVIAARRANDGSIEMTRPLCAFPRIARYDGRGDPNLAASFSCVRAPEPQFAPPSPRYLGGNH